MCVFFDPWPSVGYIRQRYVSNVLLFNAKKEVPKVSVT